MSGHSSEWTLNQPVVFVPCPGQPACPDRLFEVDGHRHYERAERRLRVRQLMAGCWESWCPCCRWGSTSLPLLVAQVSSWKRAMLRAGEHLAEMHGG